MSDINYFHKPVLLVEVLNFLVPDSEHKVSGRKVFLDCTLGGGGHTKAILDANDNNFVVGIDRDINAIDNFKKCFLNLENRVILSHNNFNDFESVLTDNEIEGLDGILLDLGVSSYQLDDAERGFSYRYNSKLDMRMDRSQNFTAYDIVNNYSELEIGNLIFKYGEERFSRRIAKNIVSERKKHPISTTFELVDIIKKSVPGFSKREKHPAKRTFQALRIAVNDELSLLSETIKKLCNRLTKGSMLAVISFHSLEDRIVKNTFKELAGYCNCDYMQDCSCKSEQVGIILTKKPICASLNELQENPRSKSAKLRVIQKK